MIRDSFEESVRSRRSARTERRGVAVLWLILAVPVLFALFCVVIDVSRIWLARIELVNGLESAALAGVQSWGPNGGATLAARQVAVDFADSSTVLGTPIVLQTNHDNVAGGPNENELCEGNLVFGGITTAAPPFVFDADVMNVGCVGTGGTRPAVRAHQTVEVPSSWTFVGLNVGPYNVTATTTAVFDCPTQTVRLIHIDSANFLCTP